MVPIRRRPVGRRRAIPVTQLLGEGNFLLHGGVSRRVRFPALRELYSGALGRFEVNPALNPEVLFVGELGVTGQLGGLEAQAVGFFQRLSDAIVRVSLGDGRLQRQNREIIRSLGLEILASYSWTRFTLAGDLTIKDVTQEDPSEPVGQREPEYQPWIAGGLGLKAVLGSGFWASGRVEHLGPRYCVHPDFDRDLRLGADTWANVELGYGFNLGSSYSGRRMELLAGVTNSTDAIAYDQCGLPQPGRRLLLQMRIF
jgi:iron complex outermembrane receptor protein